jgi:tetratricopeptide (TPR) repeat protein
MEGSSAQKHPLLQRLQNIFLLVLTLILVGLLARPIEGYAWKTVKAVQPEMNLEGIEGALGQGLVIGVLGGFRAIIADFLWIRTNTVWENRDRVKLDTMIRLVTTIDPRPDFFWINGARMIAYDVPHWRIKDEGGHFKVPESRQQQIDREQAEQAFAQLEIARGFHPEKAKFYVETGQIYMNRLKENLKAAEWFLLASKKPDAPYYVSRIYGELLRREGKKKEAYEFLKQLYRELPDVPPAQKPVILDRIREAEVTLKVPVWQRFSPDGTMLGASDETSLEQRALLLEQALGVDPAKESE